jgi:hypothetical protein
VTSVEIFFLIILTSLSLGLVAGVLRLQRTVRRLQRSSTALIKRIGEQEKITERLQSCLARNVTLQTVLALPRPGESGTDRSGTSQPIVGASNPANIQNGSPPDPGRARITLPE